MTAMKIRFSRKLHMAFAAMLLITLSLAWYFYDSVQWFEYDVKRIAFVNAVLNGNRALAAEANLKLQLIQASVERGEVKDLPQWQENTRSLRSVIAQIHQTHIDGASLRNAEYSQDELLNLDDLEILVESVIGSGETIRVALASGNISGANTEFVRFQNDGVADIFTGLMDETLAANMQEVNDANWEAISLSQYISSVLPLFMLVLAGLTTLVVWLFSRSLTRSVSILHQGVEAFTNGDLTHRIPELSEREFEHLGTAFNTLADELTEHRTFMHDSNVRLEAVVDERTRALKASNDMLEMVDENRRKLLADISHEFRTPMTVIRGEAEIAMRGKVKTKVEYKETLERIIEQSDQATRLVDDLLFMARADAGEPRLKVRPVSVGSLLGTVCTDFTAKAETCKVSLEELFSEEDSVVMGDAGRLRQVFAILVDNALQYSEAGGAVEVNMLRRDREVVVTVSDSGIGLTREETQRVFQRFFRGGQAQGYAKGTGLGLPVAKAIVEAHKGSISLQGEPGKGAVATVILPAEEKLKAVA